MMSVSDDASVSAGEATRSRVRLGLSLGGGAARGLVHIGVLEVLEREGIAPHGIAGSSMGGLIGALSAAGLQAADLKEVARGFRFPRWFLPGGLMRWNSLFGSAAEALPQTFEELKTPLAVIASDLELGTQVVLRSGPLRAAVRATCAVPGVLPAERIEGRWLVDGALLNILPVDAAWMWEPQVVVAVKVGSVRARRIPQLRWRVPALLSRLGGVPPNPATARLSFEMLVRACEIVLERQTALAVAMTGPEVLIEPEPGDIGLRDFHRLDDAVAAGRRAAEAALPELVRLLQSPPDEPVAGGRLVQVTIDPVCAMVISPLRARATAVHDDTVYSFCSSNCRDCFVRDPGHYMRLSALTLDDVRRRAREIEDGDFTE